MSVSRPVKADPPSIRSPFIDPRTGCLTDYGHRLITALFNRTGGYDDDLAGLLVPSLLGEVSALELQDQAARLQSVANDAVMASRAGLAEEILTRIEKLESPLNPNLAVILARLAETDEGLVSIERMLRGLEVFSALSVDGAVNVDGTDVSPFLGHTDGSKLTAVDGVQQDLITPSFFAYTSGSVAWSSSPDEKDLQEVTVTVERGRVVVNLLIDVQTTTITTATPTTWQGVIRLYRDSTEIVDARRGVNLIPIGGSNYVLPGQMALLYPDNPGSGTYAYRTTFEPGGSWSGFASRRSLLCEVGQG